jgi:hypothetical protein
MHPGESGGEPVVLVVEVVAGHGIVVAAPRGPVRFAPRDVERARRALDLARAIVIWQRDEW